jgi:hypothetical protein
VGGPIQQTDRSGADARPNPGFLLCINAQRAGGTAGTKAPTIPTVMAPGTCERLAISQARPEARGVRSCGHRFKLMLLPVVLAMLTAFTASSVLAQAPVGSVTEIVGGAKLERSGREAEVTLGMEVRVHDRLQTMTQSHLTVTLRGGSQLMLAELGSMLIDQHLVDADARENSTIGLLAGHLRSIVSMVAGASGTLPDFEVHTPNAVVAARGTEFDTAYIEGKPCPGFPTCLRYTDVGVYKGVVEVRSATNLQASSVRVSQGYETTVPCEIPPSSPAPLGMGELGAPGYR